MKGVFCPVFHPTKEEMKDFQGYIEKVEGLSEGFGMVKVVPPEGWKARKRGYKDINVQLTNPIRQHVRGLAGIYSVYLISEKSMDLDSYRNYAISRDPKQNLSDEEIEMLFWKQIRYDSPIYGADSNAETLFDSDSEWNLSQLDTTLSKGLHPYKLAGINMPFIYAGCWKSMFCWHKEDMDLYSINYLHFGKPKFWYCIPLEESERFERFCQFHFHDDYIACPEFLRHKSIQISPSILKKAGINVQKVVQRPGEYVVIFAKAYHMGFNSGFNCAEAVNFATPKWLDIASNVSRCLCDPDTVKIDMDEFKAKLEEYENRSTKRKSEPRKRQKVRAN
ncbi:KDM4B_2 [Blepharisma stoltei]|uniref:Uncharacterized protein n=1 Tax=Blepharisma stoltei TaxID=1481888 RepID=A0AAU9JBN1_9CILI|nr:unnamed protein product [Blepharisma stoltei]